MRKSTLCTLWAATPESRIVKAESQTTYTNLRAIPGANLQVQYGEVEAKAFGEVVGGMAWLRFDRVPDLQERDHIYLSMPTLQEDDNRGDYTVEKVTPGYHDPEGKRSRNPTTVTLKKVVK